MAERTPRRWRMSSAVTDMRTGAPRSIREFLDAGGDLSTLDQCSFLPWLVEILVGDRLRMGSRREALAAASAKNKTPAQFDRADTLANAERHGVRAAMELNFAETDLFHSWVQEMLDDGALGERVEAALPPVMVRDELEAVEAETAPLRIVVEHRGHYVCAASGREAIGLAIVLQGSAEWVHSVVMAEFKNREIVLSPGTLERALSEARQAQP
ncbi:MAG: hypothetical protein M3Q48_15365 [Actinomycetota bacterium]|nr:hypothetical protein [Actinomycetota bacterium]